MAGLDLADLKRRMDGAIEVFQGELGGLRTGRASISLLEPVTVEAYGSHLPLKQVANVNVPEPRLLTVQVWDRTMVKAVENAIRNAGLGLNPITEGQLLRVPIPELTEQRRKELAKVAHKYAEQARVSVRNVRRDGMDHLKRMEKKHEISEDEHRVLAEKVQALTDDYVTKVGGMLDHKEKEILQV